MITNLHEYKIAQEQIGFLEEWLERIQESPPMKLKGFTMAGIRKMIARIHEELGVFDAESAMRGTELPPVR